jgi:hypothetical protein
MNKSEFSIVSDLLLPKQMGALGRKAGGFLLFGYIFFVKICAYVEICFLYLPLILEL